MDIKTESQLITPTITNLFFVFTTGVNREALNENNFINAYIEDNSLSVQYPDCIYLLFQPKNKSKFRKFLDDERDRTSALIEDYDYAKGYTVVVYALDMKWWKDFEIIKTGKYSQTSKEFQAIVPKVTKVKVNGLYRDELAIQYKIIKKTPDLINHWEEKFNIKFEDDYEVWDGWKIENEILDINKFINNA